MASKGGKGPDKGDVPDYGSFLGYAGEIGENNACGCGKREECKCRLGARFALQARMPPTRSRVSGYESGKAATSKR